MKSNEIDIVFLISPLYSFGYFTPAPGAALLKSVLSRHGYKTVIFDPNPAFAEIIKDTSIKESTDLFCTNSIQEFENGLKPDWKAFMLTIVRRIVEMRPRMLAISMPHRSSFLSGNWIAKRVKSELGCPVVVGGSTIVISAIEHIERLSCSNTFDALIFGEGEIALPKVADLFFRSKEVKLDQLLEIQGVTGFTTGKNGQNVLHPNGVAEVVKDLDTIPYADFSDYPDLKSYPGKAIPISTTRGCISRCWFCSARKNQPVFRMRSAHNILREIEEKHERFGIYTFRFHDNLINGHLDTIRLLCDLVIDSNLKLNLVGPIRLTPQLNDEMIEKLVRAGFRNPILALESGSPIVRKSMGKYSNQEHVIEIIQNFCKHGARPKLNIMHSYPTETDEYFQESLDFLSIFTPKDIQYEHYPFNLSMVNTGGIDWEFIKKFEITIDKVGNLSRGTNQFIIGLRWHNANINDETPKRRMQIMKDFTKDWLTTT